VANPAPENRPIHTVRHRSLKATIWRNGTEKGVMYNVVVTRAYRDKGSNQWRDTHSLGYDDLMNVVALMHEAHSCISKLMAKGTQKVKPAARPTQQVPRAAPRQSARPQAATLPEKQLPY
jgi:hypothetical protein